MANKENNSTYLKSLVRERDMDRYLTVLLSPRARQTALFSLAALNAELAHIPEMAKEPGLSAIRYQWWRDAFSGDADESGVGEGVKTGNPVADEVNAVLIAYKLSSEKVIDLIDLYEEFENAPQGDDIKLLAVDAPLYELSARLLADVSGRDQELLALACDAAALSMAAAKFTDHEGLARSNASECTKQLSAMEPEISGAIFDAFLPVGLVEFYLKGDEESPSHQLKRMWTLWRTHRKQSW